MLRKWNSLVSILDLLYKLYEPYKVGNIPHYWSLLRFNQFHTTVADLEKVLQKAIDEGPLV